MGRERLKISDWQEVFETDDGEQPFLETLKSAFRQGLEEKCRVRLEIRSTHDGTAGSQGNHTFGFDPATKTPEDIQSAVIQALRSAPGDGFSGQLRINFYKLGHSTERFTSFTRRIAWVYETHDSGDVDRDEGYGMSRHTPRVALDLGPENDMPPTEEPFDANDANALNDLPRHGGMSRRFSAPYPMAPSYDRREDLNPPKDLGASWRYIDVSMNFAFKAMAQNQQMFDRSMSIIEGLALRFGLPESPEVHMLRETKRESQQHDAAAQSGGGAGMMPALLNLVAHLANSGSASEVVEKTARAATGSPPPQGAAARAAIQFAGRQVGSMMQRRSMDDGMAMSQSSPTPMDDGGGGGAYADEAYGSYADEPEQNYGDQYDGAQMPAAEAPNMSNLSTSEMKDVLFAWLDADPNRKNEVMSMLPDLTNKIMGS